MKRIPFYLIMSLFNLTLFAQENIFFRQSYDPASITIITAKVIMENIFVSTVSGEQIVIEMARNNKNIKPEVQNQNGIIKIIDDNSSFTKGDICSIYIYTPYNYVADGYKLESQYGAIKIDNLKSNSFIDIVTGANMYTFPNLETDYLKITVNSESGGLNLLNLNCSYFKISGFVGDILVNLKQAPQAKSIITTKYGDINLSIPIDQNFEISARSNKSTFTNNFAKTKKAAPDWVNYIHNQGGPLIQLQTFQGDITVGE